MKKLLSFILALTLILAMSAPAFAANEEGGDSVITYEVGSSYGITIPTTGVTITGASASALANVAVNAGSLINADKKLEFSISAATNYDTAAENNVGFRLKNSLDANVYLHYTISSSGDGDIIKDEVFLSATAAEVNAGKTVVLTFTPDTATQAGTYTDTITFNVATVEVKQPEK